MTHINPAKGDFDIVKAATALTRQILAGKNMRYLSKDMSKR